MVESPRSTKDQGEVSGIAEQRVVRVTVEHIPPKGRIRVDWGVSEGRARRI
eukprot:IDg14875t1